MDGSQNSRGTWKLNGSEYGKEGRVKRKLDSESVLKENENLRVWLK